MSLSDSLYTCTVVSTVYSGQLLRNSGTNFQWIKIQLAWPPGLCLHHGSLTPCGLQALGSFTDHFSQKHKSFELADPETDVEVRLQLITLATHISEGKHTPDWFQWFPTWWSLRRAVSFLIHQAHSYKSDSMNMCKGWHQCNKLCTPEELAAAKLAILKFVQEMLIKMSMLHYKRTEQSQDQVQS